MVKPLPKSRIPKDPGFIEPTINKVKKEMPHYLVNNEVFLVKSRAVKAGKELGVKSVESDSEIEVFEVAGSLYSLTREEAEKHVKTVLKKHRDGIRDVAKIFSIPKASLADKNPDMKWLLEAYGKDAILKEYTRSYSWSNSEINYYLTSLIDIFTTEDRELNFYYLLNEIKFDWMSGVNRSGYLSISEDFKSVRSDSITKEEIVEFREKMNMSNILINRRMLELTVKTAKEHAEFDESGEVVALIPFDWISQIINTNLILDELKEIKQCFNNEILGAGIVFKTEKGGNVSYFLRDDPENLDPFKKF